MEFVDLATEARFTALQSGEIDVLVRNTTWTAGRDGSEGANFLQPTFYDGQGMMVATDAPYQSVADMDGTTICVASGTTTEGNIAIEFARLGIAPAEVLSFPDARAHPGGVPRRSLRRLVLRRVPAHRAPFGLPRGARRAAHPRVTSSPRSPSPRPSPTATPSWPRRSSGRSSPRSRPRSSGSTRPTSASSADSEDPSIRTFLGTSEEGGTFDPGLGLPADYAVQVVTQVGNYAEIFEEHLAPLGLERGLNVLWTDGGLLYAPPYR